MIFKTKQPILLSSLQLASGLAKSNSQTPILSNALFDLKKDKLTIKATDLNFGVEIVVDGEGGGEEEINIAVPVGQLLEYVQTLSSQEIEIEFNEKKIVVKQGLSRANIPAIDAKEFPRFSPEKMEEGIELDMGELNGAIRKSSISIAEDDGRPLLAGLLLRAKEGKIQIVGTDGYRMGLSEISFSGQWPQDVLIPAKALVGLLKGEEKGKVVMGVDKKNNQLWIKLNNKTIVGRLLQGDFPDFNKIMASTFSTKIKIDREMLLKGVQQVAVFARQNANVINIEIGDRISLSAQATYAGSGNAEIDAQINGEPVSIAFNFRYLKDYLSIIGEGDVEIGINGSFAPVRFLSGSAVGFTHIIMPVKI